MQNALVLVVYSLQNTLDWQCTVCRMPSSGDVQFAECSGLAVYSLQNSLIWQRIVCKMPSSGSVQSAECPELTLDDTTQPYSPYPFINVYLFVGILRTLLPSPYSYLPLFTVPMFFNRHFVTFHIKLAQRPLNVTSQSDLNGISTCVFSFSDKDIQRKFIKQFKQRRTEKDSQIYHQKLSNRDKIVISFSVFTFC